MLRKFLLLLLLNFPLFASVEIKTYRFNPKTLEGNERIVLEFNEGLPPDISPFVKLEKHPPNKLVLTLENISLKGKLPERSVNQVFTSQSRFLSVFLFNFVRRESFSLLLKLKNTHVQLKTLWLENPKRFVIDLCPIR